MKIESDWCHFNPSNVQKWKKKWNQKKPEKNALVKSGQYRYKSIWECVQKRNRRKNVCLGYGAWGENKKYTTYYPSRANLIYIFIKKKNKSIPG